MKIRHISKNALNKVKIKAFTKLKGIFKEFSPTADALELRPTNIIGGGHRKTASQVGDNPAKNV